MGEVSQNESSYGNLSNVLQDGNKHSNDVALADIDTYDGVEVMRDMCDMFRKAAENMAKRKESYSTSTMTC